MELSSCKVFSLYEPENKKYLFVEHPWEKIDVRLLILPRRVKDTKQYEISTLSLLDVSTSELRLLSFTSIIDLKEFKIKMQVTIDQITDLLSV